MDSVINKIFQWQVDTEIAYKRGSLQDECTKNLVVVEQELHEQLPEQSELIDRYNDAQSKLALAEIETYFTEGFRMGARLMLELLTDIKEEK